MQLLKGGPAILRKKRSRRVASGLGARDVEASDARKVTKRRSIGGGDRALLPTHSARKESGSVMKKLGIVKAEHGTLMLLAALEKVRPFLFLFTMVSPLAKTVALLPSPYITLCLFTIFLFQCCLTSFCTSC